MTWNELAKFIMTIMPAEERDKDAIVWDMSTNNPSGGCFMKIWDVSPYDGMVTTNYSCNINTEDWF